MDKLGRYIPSGTVMSGGFGSVVICDDTHLERKVAIKAINDASEIARIEDEIRALLQLRSKHVVQVYELIELAGGSYGIVLEYIDGDDLFESDVPQQSCEDLLKVLWQISSGLADVHNGGLVHRDVKPNNIKIDHEGVVKIFDFGLSRIAPDFAKTVGFKGTLGFAAPELFASGSVVFSTAIDVYAFGVTALYLARQDLPPELMKVPPKQPGLDPFIGTSLEDLPEITSLLFQCLNSNSALRPDIVVVRDLLAKYLLKNRHQGLAVSGDQPFIVNNKTKKASVTAGLGKFSIDYDGLDFYIDNIQGEVFVNGRVANARAKLSGSCVIVVGGDAMPANRSYISFDISSPEVVL